MRKIREVLRLRMEAGLSIRQISHSTSISVGAIQKLLARAEAEGLSWPLPEELTEPRLAQLFYPGADTRVSRQFQEPDWEKVHQELRRKDMTKLLLWEEYTAQFPNRCYSYPQYCARYRQWAKGLRRSMRQVHKAGEKCFIDYCGVTVAVQVVERWITARLRHHTFFSLGELNQAIRLLLDNLNNKPFKQLPGNRRQAFETLDQPALRPLPKHAYQYTDIKPVRVNIDYHVTYEQHLYSVPHQYVGERLELHATEATITLYFRQAAVASHPRHDRPGMSTQPAHMPERHRKQGEWTPERLLQWAQRLGPDIRVWVQSRLSEKEHPEQAYRVCLGLLNLGRSYPPERLNATCRIANREGLTRLKHIRAILGSNRDQLQEPLPLTTPELPQDHANIRGPQSFH